MSSYRDLEIYQLSYNLAKEVYYMTMKLPKHELYEQGSQVRRSTQSIKDNITEGYGRRRYKAEFVRFLVFAHSSCDEATSQLNMINDIHFVSNPINELIESYEVLGSKIYRFIKYVEDNWKSEK
ncbi:MAG: four helix bundle protein [Salinivirgaceae bacterium]|nr:four helix bundle protein [Salinivirgaceae bacterium]